MVDIDLPDQTTMMDLGSMKLYFRWNDYDRTWDLVCAYTSTYHGGDDWVAAYSINAPHSTTVLHEGLGEYSACKTAVEDYLRGDEV